VTYLIAVMAMFTLAVAMSGWLLASSGVVFLVDPIAHELPADRHVPFLADLWAHSASDLIGLLGGIVVMVLVWPSRREAAAAQAAPKP